MGYKSKNYLWAINLKNELFYIVPLLETETAA